MMSLKPVITGGIMLLTLLLGEKAPAAEPVPTPDQVKSAIGHLGPVPVPPGNPLSAARVALGNKLFTDTRLSGDGSLSCETCHLPDHGYAAHDALGPAYPSQHERRNSPALVNVAYNQPLIWDGRAPDLDKQALGPVRNILHMNNNVDLLVEQLKADGDYPEAFRKAYGDAGITAGRVADALASFERTLVFDDSPLDRYMDGDPAALGASQQRGLTLFLGKAKCIQCHHGPNLTDNQFHDLGVPDQAIVDNPGILAAIRFDAQRMGLPDWAQLNRDPGRELVSKDPADRGKFRTMGLRNIESSPPYMHNGALATLADVVAFYDRGGGDDPHKSPLLEPLGLSESERGDLVAFLRALTGTQRRLPLE
ncbi:MAG: cytochrome c peroxidase [Gammaproteobacteria bacterium]